VRPGDTVTTLDDDSVMLLDFTVPSRHLAALAPGTPIEAVGQATGARHFEGKVRSVSSRIDPVTRSATVRAEIPNPDRGLKPGMLMNVDVLANRREAVTVPEGTLLPDAADTFVMVVEESPEGPMVRRRPVETGARLDGVVEILSGLEDGERVVNHGAFKVRDGAPVRILESPHGGGED
jgi:membrane fusion protein, multidrug efflux system